ncbi:MAG: hypothetical protein L7F78_16055, partial [Syntrophales bacterium LBB04]|nr:hypothetical protein [Syntrophales bacterium LBB04]
MSKATSYLRFNPDTKEIEIEGSEEFIQTYFDKLQRMLPQPPGEEKNEPESAIAMPAEKKAVEKKAAVKIPAPDKKVKAARKKAVARGARESSQFEKVVGLIQKSANGITTPQLSEKTGLSGRQIWGIT